MFELKRYDVIVIGAGVAGLATARALAEAEKSVLLLEGRSRVGGRILTERLSESELPVELGAEFVHGRSDDLWSLIDEAGLATYELGGKQMCFEEGALSECSREGTFDVLEELSENAPDMSFTDWIAEKHLPEEAIQAAIGFVEGFNAADARKIGTAALARQQKAEDAIEGDRAFRILDGYAALPAYLLKKFEEAGGELRLSCAVEAVHWQGGSVRVRVAQEEFSARKCVVTLPLGVLQAGSVVFDPVPQPIFDSASQLAMGRARRVSYVFRDLFWKDRADGMGFLFADEGLPRVWWTPAPNRAPILTGWAGGTSALNTAAMSDEEFAATGLRMLATIFHMPEANLRAELVGWHTHDWQHDPFSLGAYSYAPAGALGASEAMTAPVEGTLYFAGEHTDITGHWGTVHGALGSGLRAAKQILK
ncbi:NAD(P)/FAD-dependent oxidoreductase [Acidobacterium sp. S8]|uniref:flavin monoamine oxidase family protein n=1 Tax=Acidobacterium sp. S8 TaxID=1641854 RepID=UPI00131CA319|nr:NAD(P)/FAD-dependent oxidoreductase [Acidobacterium sp. S8]